MADMVDDMEVDKVADMVSVIVSDMVANMEVDKVADMVANKKSISSMKCSKQCLLEQSCLMQSVPHLCVF